MEIINLDQAVINALNLFMKDSPPRINPADFQLPFVVGSGNAYNTGLILFRDRPAIFADESNYNQTLKAYKNLIKKGLSTQAVIVSASGEKDSVWEVEESKKYGLHTTLLTCSADSSAAKIADRTYVYKKNPEPYTYNTSTYMGMILSTTNEQPKILMNFVKELKFPLNFSKYQSYSFVVSDKYLNLCPMLDIKKSELFGPHISLRSFTQGHARHAKYIIPWEKELVILIGEKGDHYGFTKHRWQIDLPKFADWVTMMSLTYYIIGKIQAEKPQYFKENIANYCTDYGPKAYGKKTPFEIIVPGTQAVRQLDQNSV